MVLNEEKPAPNPSSEQKKARLKEADKSGAACALAESAKRYIEEHFTEKFSLTELSGALFVNGSYLTRVFRRFNDCTPLEYHNRIRCEAAKKLLTKQELSISYISDAVGYVSAAHFSRMFKHHVGVTPSEYRHTL